MRDKFWGMYTEIKDSERYYWYYRVRAIFWDNTINFLSCIASAASISSWLIWNQVPWLWASVIALSQVINATRHLLPFSKQISSINLFLPELEPLLNSIDHDWDTIDKMSDSEISDLVYRTRNVFTSLENKYIGTVPFPVNTRCFNRAVSDRNVFFHQRYGVVSQNFKTEVLYE